MILDINQENGKFSLRDWNPRMKDVLIGIPGSKYKSKTNTFEFPLSWASLKALEGDIYGSKVGLSKEAKKWMMDHYNNVIAPGYSKRMVLGNEEGVDHVEYVKGLFPHQNADVDFILTMKKCIIANGMGSGKTRSPIAAYKVLKDRNEMSKPMLWFGPASTKSGVLKDIKAVDPTLSAVVVTGTITQRRKLLAEDHDIYIMNFEQAPLHSRLEPYGSIALKKCADCGGKNEHKPVKPAQCETCLRELNTRDFGMVVVDEAHRIINPKNKSTRAIKYAARGAEYKVAMSGTPISKTQSNLWSLLNFLSPDDYPSRTKFFDYYFVMSDNPFSGTREPGALLPHRVAEFNETITPILRRIPTKAVIDFLPPLLRSRREVVPDSKQKKAYEQMKKDMLVALDDSVLFADGVLPQMTRLLQLASSYAEVKEVEVLNTDTLETTIKQKAILSKPSSKVKAFMDDIPDYGDSQLVVFTVSSQLAELLHEELEDTRKSSSTARDKKWRYSSVLLTGKQDDRQKKWAIERFQDGSFSIIIVTTGAGSTGITLTAADTMIFLQRPWSMVENEQAEARSYRIGSEIHDHVNIIDYVWPGSIEEQVFQAIDTKKDNLQSILKDKELLKQWVRNGQVRGGMVD